MFGPSGLDDNNEAVSLSEAFFFVFTQLLGYSPCTGWLSDTDVPLSLTFHKELFCFDYEVELLAG